LTFPADNALPPLTLVLGGARSGKSAYAERLVNAQGDGLYLATAEFSDPDMAERIRIHRERRGETWKTVEEPLELPAQLKKNATPDRIVLVECLSVWVGNLMAAGRDVGADTGALIACLSGLAHPVVLVSNEVGLGGIPDNQLARDFQDAAGQLNQTVAMLADRVVLVAAGLPVVLKDVAE